MAIEFRQKLKFFKISHNHGQNLLRQLAKIKSFGNKIEIFEKSLLWLFL